MTSSHSRHALTALTLLALPWLSTPSMARSERRPLEVANAPQVVVRSQQVRALPGQLDEVLVVNDNNPELITGEGVLVSTFRQPPGLDLALNGRFDLFSHHVFAGKDDALNSTLWLAVLAQPAGDAAVTLKLLGGSTSLSQATQKGQTAAPFLPLPALMAETSTPIAAGPGSRVAGDILRGESAPELSKTWRIAPGSASALLVLPIPCCRT